MYLARSTFPQLQGVTVWDGASPPDPMPTPQGGSIIHLSCSDNPDSTQVINRQYGDNHYFTRTQFDGYEAWDAQKPNLPNTNAEEQPIAIDAGTGTIVHHDDFSMLYDHQAITRGYADGHYLTRKFNPRLSMYYWDCREAFLAARGPPLTKGTIFRNQDGSPTDIGYQMGLNWGTIDNLTKELDHEISQKLFLAEELAKQRT